MRAAVQLDQYTTEIPVAARVKTTGFAGVLSGAFNMKASVFLHRRTLRGDFNAVATEFSKREGGTKDMTRGFVSLTEFDVRKWSQGFTGEMRRAADAILADMASLRRAGISPLLRLVVAPDESDAEFHTDPTGNPFGRILCCYNGPVTRGIAAEDAVAMGGEYVPKDNARIFSFAPGDIWRHAPSGFETSFAAFIHAAQKSQEGAAPRMLLVGDVCSVGQRSLWQRLRARIGLV